jgi:glycosyltransferase involved in cell wall biosynthesis
VGAQRDQGLDSYLVHKIESDLRSAPFSAPLHTLAAGLDEYVVKAKGFPAPISLLRDGLVGIPRELLDAADVIHLHGINGALPVSTLAKLWPAKRIIWTLHDMNPFTGVCHYALDCEGFRSSCSSCPAVKTVFQSAVAVSLDRKFSAIATLRDLTVVSPSEWLADQARSSAVLAGHTINVINNPINSAFLVEEESTESGGDTSELVIAVVAQNLSDPVKNVREVANALRAVSMLVPPARLMLIGRGGSEFEGDGITRLGPLTPAEMAIELGRCDVLVSSSRAENSPLVILEAAARGCQSLVAAVGGMPELISQLGVGRLYSSRDDLMKSLVALAQEKQGVRAKSGASLKSAVHNAFTPQKVAGDYVELYEK